MNTTFWLVQASVSDRLHRLGPLGQLADRREARLDLIVLANHERRAGHLLAEQVVQLVRVLAVVARLLEQGVVVGLLVGERLLVQRVELFVRGAGVERLDARLHARRHEEAREDAREQRVGAEAVAAVVVVVALADRVEPGDVRLLVDRVARVEAALFGPRVVGPQAAHGVVDGGEDLHGFRSRGFSPVNFS